MPFLFTLLVLVIVLGLVYWIVTPSAATSAVQAGRFGDCNCDLPDLPSRHSLWGGRAISRSQTLVREEKHAHLA
jgi:hypothetical protein